VLVTGAARASARSPPGRCTPAAPTVVLADLCQDAIDAVHGEPGRDRVLALSVDVTAQHRPRRVVATAVDRPGEVAGNADGQEGLGTDIDDVDGSSTETGQRNCRRSGPTSAWSPTALSRSPDGIRGSTRICARVTACGDREGAMNRLAQPAGPVPGSPRRLPPSLPPNATSAAAPPSWSSTKPICCVMSSLRRSGCFPTTTSMPIHRWPACASASPPCAAP